MTDDNPRSEDPAAIRAAVLAGCPGGRDGGGARGGDRRGAGRSRPGDVLAVAGKGHEQGQTIGGVTLPFDDVETVRRLVGGARPLPRSLPQGEGVSMRLWEPGDLVEATGGVMRDAVRRRSGVSIDTRTLRPGDLFVALQGESRDGHASSPRRWRGARPGRWCRMPDASAADAPLLVVDDTLAGLQPARRLRPRALRRPAGGGDRLASARPRPRKCCAPLLARAGSRPMPPRHPTTTIGGCR